MTSHPHPRNRNPSSEGFSFGGEVLHATTLEPGNIPTVTKSANLAQPYLSVAQHSRRERDDAYPIIAQLDARHRVINCKDGLQWILQRRAGAGHWNSLSFYVTRAGLEQCIRRKVGERFQHMVDHLPEWHPGRTRRNLSTNGGEIERIG